MGCGPTKEVVAPMNETIIQPVLTRFDSDCRTTNSDYDSDPFEDTLLSEKDNDSIENNTRQDDEAIARFNTDNDFIEFSLVDPQAFSDSFIQQRQQAIDNSSYRKIIDSWKPNTIEQLVDSMKSLSNGKSSIDCNWFIFYWMARNILYDAVAALGKKWGDETADTVFRERKGCCGGHANLYKCLCTELNMPCEVFGGYLKTGFGTHDGIPTAQELKLINPRDEKNVSLIPGKSYVMVLIGTSSDILLFSNIKFNDTIINGYSYIVYDIQKQFYRCYFAPVNVGKHEIIISARKHSAENNMYSSAFSLYFDVNQMPKTPISFPYISQSFFDLGLQIVYPRNTSQIKIDNGLNHTQILIRAPNNTLLYGDLKNSDKQIIECGTRIYDDRRKNIWRCKFAPNQNGTFEALIIAKTNSNPDEYTGVASFNIDAKNIPTPPLSYPFTSQLFYDLNLKIVSPAGCSKIILPNNASYAEVYIRAPDNVQLLGGISQNDKTVIGP